MIPNSGWHRCQAIEGLAIESVISPGARGSRRSRPSAASRDSRRLRSAPRPTGLSLAERLGQREIDVIEPVVVGVGTAAADIAQGVLETGIEAAAGLDADLVGGEIVAVPRAGEVVDLKRARM